jgi:rubrerythrin
MLTSRLFARAFSVTAAVVIILNVATGCTAGRLFRARAIPDGLCRQCGYSLAGNVSGVCPECGTPIGMVK